MSHAEIGVIGGSGLYAFLEDAAEVDVQTPYGPPSDRLVVGEVRGRQVAFIPRHGRDHRYPPHRIPYRANLWALRSLGVRQVLAPCAVGSLRATLPAGSLVVPDQLVDRTSGRPQTYYDTGAVHVSFADPYCPDGRAVAVREAARGQWPVTDGGAMVVVEGPRFSTRAESRWFADQGWAVVNMTGHPEAVLARELALCYTAIALVTDLDAGVEGLPDAVTQKAVTQEAVTQKEVFTFFAANTARQRTLLYDVLAGLPVERACPCGSSLDGIDVPLDLP